MAMPADISWHSAFWASDPSWTPPADGGSVSQWDDFSGNTRHASQATGGSQPIYRAAVTELGGQPAVEFDGSNDFLTQAAYGTAISQPFTAVIIAALKTTTADQYFFDGVGNRVIVANDASGNWGMYAGSWLGDGAVDDQKHMFIATFNGASSTLDKDGSEIISASNPGSGALDGLTIGQRFNGSGRPLNGYVAFLGIYEGTLTTGQKDDLVSWYQADYFTTFGLQVATVNVEALTQPPSDARLSNTSIEALTQPPSDMRMSNLSLEVLVGTSTITYSPASILVGS